MARQVSRNVIREENAMLTKTEKLVRAILIKAARGTFSTHHYRKITYKELWLTQYPGETWGRGKTSEVVDWIVNISIDVCR